MTLDGKIILITGGARQIGRRLEISLTTLRADDVTGEIVQLDGGRHSV